MRAMLFCLLASLGSFVLSAGAAPTLLRPGQLTTRIYAELDTSPSLDQAAGPDASPATMAAEPDAGAYAGIKPGQMAELFLAVAPPSPPPDVTASTAADQSGLDSDANAPGSDSVIPETASDMLEADADASEASETPADTAEAETSGPGTEEADPTAPVEESREQATLAPSDGALVPVNAASSDPISPPPSSPPPHSHSSPAPALSASSSATHNSHLSTGQKAGIAAGGAVVAAGAVGGTAYLIKTRPLVREGESIATAIPKIMTALGKDPQNMLARAKVKDVLSSEKGAVDMATLKLTKQGAAFISKEIPRDGYLSATSKFFHV